MARANDKVGAKTEVCEVCVSGTMIGSAAVPVVGVEASMLSSSAVPSIAARALLVPSSAVLGVAARASLLLAGEVELADRSGC
jgi:hypothetical protein